MISSNTLVNAASRTLLSPRDYFLGMMETWLATPKTDTTQWMIYFESFPSEISGGTLTAVADSISTLGGLLDNNNKTFIQKIEGATGDGWNQTLAGSLLGGIAYQDIMGCIFATRVKIPSLDAVSVEDVGIENNAGFKKGVATNGRAGFAGTTLGIDFRETNASFADLVIKPWTFLTARYGGLPFYGHKTNIIIMEFAKTYQHVTQTPHKVWLFKGARPISVSEIDLSYDKSNGDVPRTTQWAFDDYQLSNNINIPLLSLVKKSSFNRIWNSNLF